jgi:hypothetical protein
MNISQNVELSIYNEKNMFFNSFVFSIDNKMNISDSFFIDVHPLYGYVDIPNIYIWSYGINFNNVFFNNYLNVYNDHKPFRTNNNQNILYFIVFEAFDDAYIEKLIENIYIDLIKIKQNNENEIKFISYFKNDKILKEFNVLHEFDLTNEIKNCSYIVINRPCQLTILAYYINQTRCYCFYESQYDPYKEIILYSFIEDNDSLKAKNINNMLKNLELFTLKNLNNINHQILHSSVFNKYLQYRKILMRPLVKKYDAFMLNDDGYKEFELFKNLSQTLEISSKTLVLTFCVNENVLSYMFLKKYMNIIFFDYDPIIHNNNSVCFRYYIFNYFSNISLSLYTNKIKELDVFFEQKATIDTNGKIIVCFDYSNGLHVKDTKTWKTKWNNELDFIINTYTKNEIILKFHPNDTNYTSNNYDIKKVDKLHTLKYINNDILENKRVSLSYNNLENILKDNNICFVYVDACSSTYLKCLQYGKLIFSKNEISSKNIFCINNNSLSIDKYLYDSFNKFSLNRLNALEDNLKNLVRKEDLENCFFFEKFKHLYF